MAQAFLFYFFAGLSVLGALGVILHPKPTRALLFLIVTMTGLGVLFLQLGAYFVAMGQLVVYAGAVLVLFLFVIMLQGVGAVEIPLFRRFHAFYLASAAAVVACLGICLFLFLRRTPLAALQVPDGTVEGIGQILFRRYLLPFEWTSLLILLGVFAAVALARKDDA